MLGWALLFGAGLEVLLLALLCRGAEAVVALCIANRGTSSMVRSTDWTALVIVT